MDSKLHTPEGGFMLFLVLGALTPRRRGIFVPLGPRTRACWPLLVAVLLLPGVIRMAREVSSAYVARTATPGDLARATEIYPGNHWAHLQLARAMERQGRCDLAVLHRRHARELYPTPLAPEPVACPDQPRQAARHPSR